MFKLSVSRKIAYLICTCSLYLSTVKIGFAATAVQDLYRGRATLSCDLFNDKTTTGVAYSAETYYRERIFFVNTVIFLDREQLSDIRFVRPARTRYSTGTVINKYSNKASLAGLVYVYIPPSSPVSTSRTGDIAIYEIPSFDTACGDFCPNLYCTSLDNLDDVFKLGLDRRHLQGKIIATSNSPSLAVEGQDEQVAKTTAPAISPSPSVVDWGYGFGNDFLD
ncbi:MAG: hypothetical protein KME17_24840 [Cyanosarcina radialis HA8281-LM2]|nr:hypothetical protein [Cyanosarcina radialis HA8281-LM2]